MTESQRNFPDLTEYFMYSAQSKDFLFFSGLTRNNGSELWLIKCLDTVQAGLNKLPLTNLASQLESSYISRNWLYFNFSPRKCILLDI